MTRISDRRLIARLETLAARERATTLSVLLHLNEVERRGLHLAMGYASMFDFATRRLGYSAPAAGRRVQVARCIRRHPEIVALLRRNEVNLSSICMIGRVITAENCATLLDSIRGKSQREVEALAAAYRPRIRIRDRVTPVALHAPGAGNGRPERPDDARTPGLFESRSAVASVGAEGNGNGGGGTTGMGSPTAGERVTRNRNGDEPVGGVRTGGDGNGVAADRGRADGRAADDDCAPQPGGRPEEKFRVQFAAGSEFVRKFEAVRALLSSRFPRGASFEQVFEATMESFLERHSPEERSARREQRRARARSGERARRTEEPHATRSTSRALRNPTRSRHVPAAIRDAVHARDGRRCTYVGPDGRRCSATHHLQIDHVTPFGKGGATTSENLRLLCAAHNGLEAERAYGSDWMRRFRGGAGGRPAPDPELSRIGWDPEDRRSTARNAVRRE
jgi:5-methylcytosine-specific restriction endonuclease McrA